MSEQFPAQAPDQAPDQDPHSKAPDQPPIALPSESVGAPAPPRDLRKGLRIALVVALVVGLACLLTWNTARLFVSIAYAFLLIVTSVRALVRIIWRRRRRSRPLSRH